MNNARYGLGSLLQGCGVPPLMLDATHGRTVQNSRWLTTPCVIPISRSRISPAHESVLLEMWRQLGRHAAPVAGPTCMCAGCAVTMMPGVPAR